MMLSWLMFAGMTQVGLGVFKPVAQWIESHHMNIGYLSSSEIPSRAANSIHVMRMCQALAQNGHQVDLFVKSEARADTDDFAHYGVAPCFGIVRCKRPRFRKLLGDFEFAREVAQRVRERPRPELLFARHIYSLAGVASLGIPMMFEAHTPPVNILQRAVEGWVVRQRCFLRLIVISAALRIEYQRLFPWLADSKILVAHDAADPLDSEPEALPETTWPGRSGALQVGYVGHLYPGRGIGLIIELARRLPDVDFHLVGGMDKDLDRWQRTLHPDNLILHGFVAPRQLRGYFVHFDVLLAPYQQRVLGVGRKKETSQWMSPLKIFEYMAAGKAMVCSDHPVFHEILTHQRNCWLVPPADIDAWHRAIELLRRDHRLRDSLGACAQRDFLAQHTWKQRAAAILDGNV
jgi:glycosyltransferase involved in cell wall biosynthesis